MTPPAEIHSRNKIHIHIFYTFRNKIRYFYRLKCLLAFFLSNKNINYVFSLINLDIKWEKTLMNYNNMILNFFENINYFNNR